MTEFKPCEDFRLQIYLIYIIKLYFIIKLTTLALQAKLSLPWASTVDVNVVPWVAVVLAVALTVVLGIILIGVFVMVVVALRFIG